MQIPDYNKNTFINLIPDKTPAVLLTSLQTPSNPDFKYPELAVCTSGLLQLPLVLTLMTSEYKRRHFWLRLTMPAAWQRIELTPKLQIGCSIGQKLIDQIIKAMRPENQLETIKRRGYLLPCDLDGVYFAALIGKSKDGNFNTVSKVLAKDDPLGKMLWKEFDENPIDIDEDEELDYFGPPRAASY